jgi:hypothetical protein
MNDDKIIEWLNNNGFTDRVDIDAEISLFEYGIIRNPSTGRTIFALTDGIQVIGIDWSDISIEDVREALEEIESGFYDFIGSTKEEVLKNLNNDYLTNEINTIRGYGSHWDYLDYDLNKEDIVSLG